MDRRRARRLKSDAMVALMGVAVLLAVLPLFLILGSLVLRGAESLSLSLSSIARPRSARRAAASPTRSLARWSSSALLRSSPFRPTICEVTVAELWAFAQSWGEKRKESLKRMTGDLLILPISDVRIHMRWAELYSFARSKGLAIQHDHNDVWIAAVAHASGLKLLSTSITASTTSGARPARLAS